MKTQIIHCCLLSDDIGTVGVGVIGLIRESATGYRNYAVSEAVHCYYDGCCYAVSGIWSQTFESSSVDDIIKFLIQDSIFIRVSMIHKII